MYQPHPTAWFINSYLRIKYISDTACLIPLLFLQNKFTKLKISYDQFTFSYLGYCYTLFGCYMFNSISWVGQLVCNSISAYWSCHWCFCFEKRGHDYKYRSPDIGVFSFTFWRWYFVKYYV